jgi:hypothetical protein
MACQLLRADIPQQALAAEEPLCMSELGGVHLQRKFTFQVEGTGMQTTSETRRRETI